MNEWIRGSTSIFIWFFVQYIDLAGAKSEASIYILIIKSIKNELTSSKPLKNLQIPS